MRSGPRANSSTRRPLSLSRATRDIPSAFVAELFARAVPEDLVACDAHELATLAEAAFALLGTREPGTPKIRLSPGANDGHLKSISVLEIVNDDMPFLVDSVMGELTERNLNVSLVAHPVFSVERDRAGRLTTFNPARGGSRESFIHIHLERIDDEGRRTEIVAALEQVLADVRLAVADWRPMRARVGEVIAELKSSPPPLAPDEIREAVAFLEWLIADNFTFLGVRDYVLTDKDHALDPLFETGLGIMRERELRVLKRGGDLLAFTPEILAFLQEPQPLIIAKAAVRSRVHRRIYMDYVGVKRFDAAGRLTGEFRIVGLFTSTAYTRSTRTIPYLRHKVEAVLQRAGFDPEGHSGKALANVLESYPRDELFQIDEDTLYRFALAILQLDERPRVRVLARRDRFDRFVSALVYVPRERYDSEVRKAIGDYLAEVFKGRVSAFYTSLPEGRLARVHFIIGRLEGATPDVPRATLEQMVSGIVLTWRDGFYEALDESARASQGAGAVRAVSRCVLRGLSRGLFALHRGRRHPHDRGIVGGAPARRRFLPQRLGRADLHPAEGVEPQPPDPALGTRAGARKHGLSGGRRAHLPDRSGRCTGGVVA